MLHILNGDAIAKIFRETGLPGDVLVWREALAMGPCPGDLSQGGWLQTRAEHLSEAYHVDRDECLSSLRETAEVLERADPHEEVVLWFEFDLFCQINLICALSRLSNRPKPVAKISLICIDCFPGIERFRGMGQLNPHQLTSLFEQRQELSPPALAFASTAWHRFTGSNPDLIAKLLRQDINHLPYLDAALQAHLARFPSSRNGLGRIENLLLDLIAGGVDEFKPLFHMIGDIDPVYGFGDWQIWKHLEFMSHHGNPLLTIHNVRNGNPDQKWEVFNKAYFKLTDVGRAVLVGNSDMLNVNDVDYWLGGVRIGSDTTWRWNEEKGLLVQET